MLRRISSVLLLAALLTVGLIAPVALAAPPEGKGQQEATEPIETGGPGTHKDGTIIADDWGSVASELGELGVMGQHSSNPFISEGDLTAPPQDINRETERDGLGNVARRDSLEHGVTGPCSEGEYPEIDNCDSGDNLSDHACVAAAAAIPRLLDENGDPVEPDCTAEPGNRD